MEEGIIARLLASGALTALVSQRVYPGRRPQASALPAIDIASISGAPIYTDQGEAGLATARVEINCWGSTYTSAKQVARAVTVALSAFFGDSAGITFQYILKEDERDFSEPGSNAADYLFRTSIDFTVWWET
jgi:uncharacterized protein YdaL